MPFSLSFHIDSAHCGSTTLYRILSARKYGIKLGLNQSTSALIFLILSPGFYLPPAFFLIS